MSFHDMEIKGVLRYFGSSEQGLSSEQIIKLREKFGSNELKGDHQISKLRIFIEQFKSSIVLILIVATILSAFLGEWVDATAIFIILILNSIMGYIQEFKAEKAIEELKKLSAPRSTVLREGKIQKIDSTEVVPGDILLLQRGDKISADARLIEASSLEVQEAVLTGESIPVKKETKILDSNLEIGNRKNMIFSATTVTKGKGKAVVVSTGMKTEVGKIADMIQTTEKEMTPLQKKLGKLGQKLGILTLIVSAIVFAVGISSGQDFLVMFLVAVSLAVAAIPEGLPAVITISLSFGVQRMLEKNALIRRLPSVETLGSTTIICSDKTGTLTHNEMTVTHIYNNGKIVDVSGSGYSPEGEIKGGFEKLLFEIGALCNDSDLVEESWTVSGDPTEGCLLTSARKAGVNEKEMQKKHPRLGEVPFDSRRKRMTTIHEVGGKRVACMKGGPDVILDLCNRILIDGEVKKLTPKGKQEILKVNKKFSQGALRVLGFAYDEVEELKEYDDTIELNMIFVGLQAMIDPPREEVKEAIEKCKTAGIKIAIVTGDYLDTAAAIAKELGIKGEAVEGKDIDKSILKRVDKIAVYARVNPEHKLNIIEALKKKGHVVAMTGDGVNDAPALKKADIGISMGVTGTDVAKEASEIILTDDNFASIVNAIEEGRGIFDNIKKFVNYLLSSNLGEVLVLFTAMLIGFKTGDGTIIVPLLAIQILWVNLVTDGLPALALGVDPAEEGIMQRAPRDPKESIITRNMAWNIVVIGILICVATLFLFNLWLPNVEKARTIALTTLVVMEIVRLQMIRQSYHISIGANKYLIWAVLGVLLLQILAIYTPLNQVLKLVPIGLIDWVYIVIVCALMMGIGIIASHFIKQATHQRD